MPPDAVATFSRPPDDLGNPIALFDVASDGSHIFVASDHGLYVLARSGDAFTVVGHDGSTDLRSCAVLGAGYVVCAGRGVLVNPAQQPEPHELVVYDVSTPDAPRAVSLSAQDDRVSGADIALAGATALVVDELGVAAWDCSDPTDPVAGERWDMSWPMSVRVWKTWMFAAAAGVDNPPHQGSMLEAVDLSGGVSGEVFIWPRNTDGPERIRGVAVGAM